MAWHIDRVSYAPVLTILAAIRLISRAFGDTSDSEGQDVEDGLTEPTNGAQA